MSVDLTFITEGYFSVRDVLQMQKLAVENFSEVSVFSAEQPNQAFFCPSRLPIFYEAEGIVAESISTTGYLPLKASSLDSFESMLERLSDCCLIVSN